MANVSVIKEEGVYVEFGGDSVICCDKYVYCTFVFWSKYHFGMAALHDPTSGSRRH